MIGNVLSRDDKVLVELDVLGRWSDSMNLSSLKSSSDVTVSSDFLRKSITLITFSSSSCIDLMSGVVLVISPLLVSSTVLLVLCTSDLLLGGLSGGVVFDRIMLSIRESLTKFFGSSNY